MKQEDEEGINYRSQRHNLRLKESSPSFTTGFCVLKKKVLAGIEVTVKVTLD